jgi:uncharacterized protein (DUF1778 family)
LFQLSFSAAGVSIDRAGTVAEAPRYDQTEEEVLSMSASVRRKHDVIRIRTSAEVKAILKRAAALRGQRLSEFVLQSARREAEQAILDQRTFFLDNDKHARFLALLNSPSKPSAKARIRLNQKPLWES